MRLKSIGLQIGLLFVVGIVLFVAVTGWLSWSISEKALIAKGSAAYQEAAAQTSGKLDFLYGSFEQILLQMMVDAELERTVTGLAAPGIDPVSAAELANALDDRLQFYMYANPAIASIEVLKPDGGVIPTTSGLLRNESYADRDWFKRALSLNGQSAWIEGNLPENRNANRTISLARVIRGQGQAAQGYCVMLIDVSLSALANQLAGIRMGSGKVEVVATDGTVVYSPDDERIGAPSGLAFPAADAGGFRAYGGAKEAVFAKSRTNGWLTVGLIPVSDLSQGAKRISQATIAMLLVSLLFAAAAGFAVARVASRRLGRVRDLMRLGAEGNLTVRSGANPRGDEIAQLGASFDAMMGQSSALLRQVAASAAEVLATAAELADASARTDAAAREIAAASADIASGGEGLAAEAERGAALTEAAAARARQAAGACRELEAQMRAAHAASERGARQLRLVGGRTDDASRLVSALGERAGQLGVSAKAIRQVLDLLTRIAQRTNILSLNASIEAARAGAAGKGFMVVAGEIRQLAEQSNASIGSVGELVQSIQDEIGHTVSALSAADALFREQLAATQEADLLFAQVGTRMDDAGRALAFVGETVAELDASQTALLEAMTNVGAVSEQSLASSQEAASLSHEQLSVSAELVGLSVKLRQLSDELRDSLSRFTI